MTSLSIVIPALNEEDGIREIAERVLNTRPALAAVGFDQVELIVVDDGSTDQTPAIVSSMPEVRLIRHPTNRGYGAALKTGFAAAQGEWIGFLDADGTYPPELFPELCQAAIQHQADIVIGSRMAGRDSQMPLVRRLGNILFAHLVSLISAQRITDSASGMRIFRKAILEHIYPLPDGLNLTPVMSTRALHENLRMVEVPIPYSERIGRSKLSVVRDGARFAQSILWTALTYNPVRILGLISLVALLVAAGIGAWLVGLRLSGVTSLSGVGAFAVFSALVLSVAGVSILILGASFNYFVSLFHKRPVRQGLFGRPLFRKPLENHFGWMGLLTLAMGLVVAGASLYLAWQGWPLTRLWLYYLASASLALIGIQLIVGWTQMQILAALQQREALIDRDIHADADAVADNTLSSPVREAVV